MCESRSQFARVHQANWTGCLLEINCIVLFSVFHFDQRRAEPAIVCPHFFRPSTFPMDTCLRKTSSAANKRLRPTLTLLIRAVRPIMASCKFDEGTLLSWGFLWNKSIALTGRERAFRVFSNPSCWGSRQIPRMELRVSGAKQRLSNGPYIIPWELHSLHHESWAYSVQWKIVRAYRNGNGIRSDMYKFSCDYEIMLSSKIHTWITTWREHVYPRVTLRIVFFSIDRNPLSNPTTIRVVSKR